MFPEYRSTLDGQAVKLIASLKFDPGYLLLCDMLQARFDDLTDRLAENKSTIDANLAELQYWRAFREILHTLKVQPENFDQIAEAEGLKTEEESLTENRTWSRLQPDKLKSILHEKLNS